MYINFENFIIVLINENCYILNISIYKDLINLLIFKNNKHKIVLFSYHINIKNYIYETSIN